MNDLYRCTYLFIVVHQLRRVLIPLILAMLIVSVTPTITSSNEKPTVVCTTTVLASIVEDLASDLVNVEVIASPTICPAHYDVRPSDVEKVRQASLILYHGFEPWIEDLVKASGSGAPMVKVSGPWSTPKFLKDKYVAVANALRDYLGIDVSDRLDKCLKGIDEVDEWLKGYAEEHGFTNTPVVSMLWQKGFITYLGFKVVATFKPPEMVSAKEYSEIVENASKANALLVIDNLQSGTELGKKIADEVGAIEVALTNFPKTAPGLNNVTKVMKYNAKLLADALSQVKYVKELTTEVGNLRSEVGLWRTLSIASLVINVLLAISVGLLVIKLRRR